MLKKDYLYLWGRIAMDKNIQIVSLHEKPELADEVIAYANQNWPPISKYFTQVVQQVLTRHGSLPKCFILLRNEQIIGFYSLLEQDFVERKDLSPWIATIFVDEKERGQRLCKEMLLHGRAIAGDLGFDKVYLSSNHIQFYEKYGFKEIGLDMFVWGRPTKIYEHSSIRNTQLLKTGTIIFLNGVSSSGKTTLSLALQQKLNEPYFIISQDIFRQMWGEKFWEDSPDNMYNQTMSLMYKTVRLFSNQGKNVIVDHIMLSDAFLDSYNGEGTLKDAVNQLIDCPLLFVHVTCDINELRKREKERGDRDIGHAEQQLAYLYPQDTYDVIVDTHANTIDECVDKIINSLNVQKDFRAFNILKKQLK
jgi:chloramphenicol 3-O-phosphotransferase/N-acetylglutamate synthase-like GNAT family acetyltransferase